MGVEVEAEGEGGADARALEQMRIDKQTLSSTARRWRITAKDTALPGEGRLALCMINRNIHFITSVHTLPVTPCASQPTRHRALSVHDHNG